MFYNIQTLCDTVCIFSLHLINFKGVIGVPVAMTPIFFFVLEHDIFQILVRQYSIQGRHKILYRMNSESKILKFTLDLGFFWDCKYR